MKLSQVLSCLMDDANISAYKMSKDTGISDRLIGYWKNGDKMPNAENLLVVANYFDISVDYLLTGEEKSPSMGLKEEVKNDSDFAELMDIYIKLSEREKGELIGYAKCMHSKSTPEIKENA